jgi:hypothetical protein
MKLEEPRSPKRTSSLEYDPSPLKSSSWSAAPLSPDVYNCRDPNDIPPGRVPLSPPLSPSLSDDEDEGADPAHVAEYTSIFPWMCVYDLDAACGADTDAACGADATSAVERVREPASNSLDLKALPTGFLPGEWQDLYYNGMIPVVTKWFGGHTPDTPPTSRWTGHLPLEDENKEADTGRRRRRRHTKRKEASAPSPSTDPTTSFTATPQNNVYTTDPASPRSPLQYFDNFASDRAVEAIYVPVCLVHICTFALHFDGDRILAAIICLVLTALASHAAIPFSCFDRLKMPRISRTRLAVASPVVAFPWHRRPCP